MRELLEVNRIKFGKSEIILLRGLNLNFRAFTLEIKLWRECPLFKGFLTMFSSFYGKKAILGELLKVKEVNFGKSEKILPRECTKGVIFKI